MTKTTLERIISTLIKPIIGLGIMGTILALEPNYANAQTPLDNPDVHSTEMDTTDTSGTTIIAPADAAIDPFEAVEAKARENCKNTTLELKLKSVEEYVANEKRSGYESRELSRLIKRKPIKVCTDQEFITDLNQAYKQISDASGLTSGIDIEYVIKNYDHLKQRLKEVSPNQIKHNLDYFKRLFSKDKGKYAWNLLKKYPEEMLTLGLGEAPENYVSALKKMIGKTNGTDVYVALIGLLSDSEDMVNISYRLSALEKKGFKNVSAPEISNLLEKQNFERIETVSNPALLYSELGIIQFGWFSTELLERTIHTIEHPQEKPAAIYFLTRQPEINGMMIEPETSDDYALSELKDYAPIAVQPGTDKKLGEILTYLHGRGVKAGNITFNLHGQQNLMLVDGYGDKAYFISKDTMSEWLRPLDQILADDATIILSSCLTGAGEDNIAKDIALATHRRTYAPSEEMMAGMFWYVSPDEVHLGRLYNLGEDREAFTPPLRENKFKGLAGSAFDKVIDLTKRYYFPKEK
jgi:hypothetical protein